MKRFAGLWVRQVAGGEGGITLIFYITNSAACPCRTEGFGSWGYSFTFAFDTTVQNERTNHCAPLLLLLF